MDVPEAVWVSLLAQWNWYVLGNIGFVLSDEALASGTLSFHLPGGLRSHGLGLDSVLGDMPSKRAGKGKAWSLPTFLQVANATEPLVSTAYIILRFLPFSFVFFFVFSLQNGC